MASRRRTIIQPISVPPYVYEIIRKKSNISKFVCDCIVYYEKAHKNPSELKRELQNKARELVKQINSIQEKIKNIEEWEQSQGHEQNGGENHDK